MSKSIFVSWLKKSLCSSRIHSHSMSSGLNWITENIACILPAQFRHCLPRSSFSIYPQIHPTTHSLSLFLHPPSTPIYPTAANSQSPSNGQISPYLQPHRPHSHHPDKENLRERENGYPTSGSSESSCSQCRTADVRSRTTTTTTTNNNNNTHAHAHTEHGCECSSRVCKNHTTTTTTTLEYELSNFAKLTTRITTQSNVEAAAATAATADPQQHHQLENSEITGHLPQGLPLSSRHHWNQLQRSLHALHTQQQQINSKILQQQRSYTNNNNNNNNDTTQYENMSKPVNVEKYAPRDRLGFWGSGDNEISGSISGLDRLYGKRYSKVSGATGSVLSSFFFSAVDHPSDPVFAVLTKLWKSTRQRFQGGFLVRFRFRVRLVCDCVCLRIFFFGNSRSRELDINVLDIGFINIKDEQPFQGYFSPNWNLILNLKIFKRNKLKLILIAD